MKIVIPVLGFDRTGGYRVLSRLASEWKAMGARAIFVCHRMSDPPYFPTSAEIDWVDDFGRSCERGVGTHTRFGALRLQAACLGGLSRWGEESTREDVFLANHSLTAWAVAIAPGAARRFYYVQAYEAEYYAANNGVKAGLLAHLSEKTYALPLSRVVNSPLYRNFRRLNAETVVLPGLDFDVFRYRERPLEENRPLVVGCVGRREPEKGTAAVLRAYGRLIAAGVDVRLRVAYQLPAGEPAEGVERVVPRDDRELSDFYRSLDVLVAPGTVQLGAAHYPVLEAMACGVAVVTTGYVPADPGNAWIVPVDDDAAIADAIRSIRSDPREAVARCRAAREAVKALSWPRLAGEFLRTLQNEAS